MAEELNRPNPLLQNTGDTIKAPVNKITNFFGNVNERRKARKSDSDRVNDIINIDSFKSKGGFGNLLDNIDVNVETGIIEEGITPTDISPGGQLGLGSAGVVQVGEFSMPIHYAKQGFLPLGLMEKRKKAIRDAVVQKNKQMTALFEMPDNIDEMYSMQMSDIMVDLADKYAGNPDFEVDYRNPLYKQYLSEKTRADGLARMFSADGMPNTIREIRKTLQENGGDLVLFDPKTKEYINQIASGKIDFDRMITDKDYYNEITDAVSKIEATHSMSKLFETQLKDNISPQIESVIKRVMSTATADISAEEVTKIYSESEINETIDAIAIEQGLNKRQTNLLKKHAFNKFKNSRELQNFITDTSKLDLTKLKQKQQESKQKEPQVYEGFTETDTNNTVYSIGKKDVPVSSSAYYTTNGDRVSSPFSIRGDISRVVSRSDAEALMLSMSSITPKDLSDFKKDLDNLDSKDPQSIRNLIESNYPQMLENLNSNFKDLKYTADVIASDTFTAPGSELVQEYKQVQSELASLESLENPSSKEVERKNILEGRLTQLQKEGEMTGEIILEGRIVQVPFGNVRNMVDTKDRKLPEGAYDEAALQLGNDMAFLQMVSSDDFADSIDKLERSMLSGTSPSRISYEGASKKLALQILKALSTTVPAKTSQMNTSQGISQQQDSQQSTTNQEGGQQSNQIEGSLSNETY